MTGGILARKGKGMSFLKAVIIVRAPFRFLPGGIYAALFLAGALLLSGCGGTGRPQDKYPEYTSYRDIPGITEEEITAIESLRVQRESFVYGMIATVEAFYNAEGQIEGYAVLFCRWLTELFGIPFTPAIYEWDHLLAGLESGAVDFSGELTATEERREKYYMTGAIAERSVKYMRIEGSQGLPEIAESRPCATPFWKEPPPVIRWPAINGAPLKRYLSAIMKRPTGCSGMEP
jgi:hypothetical protein